jgi:hypothetical protein
VLDDGGVKSVDVRPGGVELKPWPVEGAPEAMWGGHDSFFFVRVGGELHMHGWKQGSRINKTVRGVQNPKKVARGLYYSCVLDDGGVACVENVDT